MQVNLLMTERKRIIKNISIRMERKRINRLKVVLAEKGMTNKQLSEILDKDPAVISKWVTNAAQPNVEMFIRLAQILSVSVDELLWTEK